MVTELILRNLGKHIALDQEEQSYFVDLLKSRDFIKRSFIQKSNEPCKQLHFVNSGILRACFTNDEGKESTVMFAMPDWWITDMSAFINEQPAMLSIEAIQSCNVLSIYKKDLDLLYERVPKVERFFRIIMQNAYIREQLRMIQNLSLSAEDRYYNFLNKYTEIAENVTQKQIASYLGITPEFLSIIRSNKN